jgi:hypothetical protein
MALATGVETPPYTPPTKYAIRGRIYMFQLVFADFKPHYKADSTLSVFVS